MRKVDKNIIYTLFIRIIILSGFPFNIGYSQNDEIRSASQVARQIVDKIISESSFETKTVKLLSELGMQVLNFDDLNTTQKNYHYYSITNIYCPSDTSLNFGLNFSGDLEIYINNKSVFDRKNGNETFIKEIAYTLFNFSDTFTVDLEKGKNTILCRLKSNNDQPIVFLREIPKMAEDELTAEFKLNILSNENLLNQWLIVGPIDQSFNLLPELLENKIKDNYVIGDKKYEWKLIEEKSVEELFIPKINTYQRESYLEWHYANGTVLFGMQEVAKVLHDSKYSDFVDKALNYTLQNYELFKKQYFNKFAFRGSNHRMFRKTMLDDTGAPALPYLQNYLETKNKNLKYLIDEMCEYVSSQQIRLEDGTFCRPEPIEMTIWADDLFMSVPFLIRMGKLTNENKYFDDASTQVINFYNYLFDEEIGLCKHAWFSPTNGKSVAYWGRANGWMLWAVSEVLLYLPKNHASYSKILNLFRNHLNGIIKFQEKNGMWHQVLDKPESFEETSCTAMYIIAISRGVQNNWIDTDNKKYASLAWQSLKTKISSNGIVKDICRGTSVGYDYDFYFNRKRFENDPRGLGAVLTATTEMIKLGY